MSSHKQEFLLTDWVSIRVTRDAVAFSPVAEARAAWPLAASTSRGRSAPVPSLADIPPAPCQRMIRLLPAGFRSISSQTAKRRSLDIARAVDISG
jgi:hypothetical protein